MYDLSRKWHKKKHLIYLIKLSKLFIIGEYYEDTLIKTYVERN